MNRSKLIRGFIDDEGYARAQALNETDERANSLAYLLRAGMQGNEKSAEKALDRLAAFERGERADAVIGGNDIVIRVSRNEAVFINRHLSDDEQPDCRYTIDELRDALEDWRDMIKAFREESSRDESSLT